MKHDAETETEMADFTAEDDAKQLDHAVIRVSEKEALIGLVQGVNRLNRIVLILAVGLVIVSAIAAVGYYRRPKVIISVLTADGQRVAKIDDLSFGATEHIQMGEDNLQNADKQELINNWLQLRFGVDLASRQRDVPKFLSLMTPAKAQALFKELNESGELQRERDEGWSASWSTESFDIDRSDKNLAQVIGTQILRRNTSGKIKQERIQYKILFQLYTEGKREGTPLRTGYWIPNFKAEVISRSEVNQL